MNAAILVCSECSIPCLLLPGDAAEYCNRGYTYEDVRAQQEAGA